MTRVLQMLEAASRNASRFADTIEYAIFTQVSQSRNASRFAVSYLYILEKDCQVIVTAIYL